MASRHALRALDIGLLAGVALTAAGGWQVFKKKVWEEEDEASHHINDAFGTAPTEVENALFEAAARGDCEKIDEVVATGAPVDAVDSRFLRTPLCVAAAMSQPAAVEALVKLVNTSF